MKAEIMGVIAFSAEVTKEGRQGYVELSMNVQGMSIAENEFAELRKLQERVAEKVNLVLHSNEETMSMLSGIKFIGFSSIVEKKGCQGTIQVFTQVEDMKITDEELSELRSLQEKMADEVKAIIEH